jgi:DNA-binding HxlR family transcriptional regulator
MFDGIDESKMCPIGLASHLLGDKWIAIIIRDIALLNRRTFSEILKKNAEGISSGSLASRLQRMVELNMLNVESDKTHAQKKIYTLTVSGIGFVPVIFKLACWTAQYRNPSSQTVAMAKPYIDGDADKTEFFFKTLWQIHIEKSIEPKSMWWAA